MHALRLSGGGQRRRPVAAIELERADGIVQLAGLLLQALRGGSALFNQGRVLLGDPVQCRNGGIDSIQALALLGG